MKFERQTLTVDAIQWFKDGDHPLVHMLPNQNAGVRVLGWLVTNRGAVAVGVGDWVVQDEFRDYKVLSDEVFRKIYKEVS